MGEKMNRILEYEKRLIQDRQRLMELMVELEGSQDEMVAYKLECFRKEIDFMSRQVELLKQEVQSSTETVTELPEQKVSVQKQPEQQKTGQPAAKKDLEKAVGKSLMGIFASILIFISLILFATLLLPYFNDTAKMITTYVVSFVFLGIGISKLKKDGENRFYIALTACGMGAVYISLMLSTMYFKALDDIPLYILIGVWGAAVSLFARRRNLVFEIISEAGITISVLFGCVLCVDTGDQVKMLVLIFFYIVSSAVFYVIHFEKEYADNLVHHISNAINVCMLATAMLDIVDRGVGTLENWLVLVFVLVNIGSTLWHKLEKNSSSIWYGIIAAVYAFLLCYVLDYMFDRTDYFEIIAYAFLAALLALYEWKKAGQPLGKNIVQIVLLVLCATILGDRRVLFICDMVLLLILPVLLVGFWRRNQVFKYGSVLLLFIYSFDIFADSHIPGYLLGCIVIIAGFVLLWWRKEQYSRKFKYLLHIVAVFFFLTCTDDFVGEICAPFLERTYELEDIVTYILVAWFNMGMLKSIFGRNTATGEQESVTIYNVINLIAMMVGMFCISDFNSERLHIFWQILLIMTVLGTFMINAKNLLDKREKLWTGIYVGIKFTMLLIVILNSFDTVNYVVSIACLLLAIGSIVFGFAGEYKSLRIFGLVLSMISTFKLLMVDINYENTLGNAISFFVSGILCFAISLIYNYIDNRFKERL